MKEFEFIDWIKTKFTSNIDLPLGDDCAVFSANNRQIVISSDTVVNNVHFSLEYFDLDEIGSKAIETACSDLVAMVCEPKYVLVNLVCPKEISQNELKNIYSGIYKACSRCGVELIGGDTSSGKELMLAVTIIGFAFENIPPVRRNGAQVGDHVYVSGKLGASFLGLQDIENNIYDSNYAKIHRNPKCQIELIQGFKTNVPSSMIDISDGLSSELNHLLNAGKHGFRIDHEKLEELKIDPKMTIEQLVNCGEDYELLYTGKNLGGILIGEVIAEPIVYITDADSNIQKVLSGGFEHF